MELVKIEDQRVAEQQEEFGPWQEELVGVKIDVKNAFNTCSPTAIISALEEETSLKHMTWAVSACPRAALRIGGQEVGNQKDRSHSR